ncbi:rpsU-divergently transcribed protein [Emergomyces pasteurianus Ep9510]|uniref:RpsU-divergently transcribed protein n=1 Tax=Emergomyces pasteurianus Ep9510 TaxID=1447872 RepID=A0A1J9PTK1_9EURO|nr:rpsU-divergently transcribed protein [Emergomyces pasteurianus Ep9510]
MASDTWGPHHITDNDRGPWVTIMASLMMVYMIFCYLARILTRMTINGPFGSDDWIITTGTAIAIIHSSVKLIEVRDGLGKRLSDVEEANILGIQKAAYAGDIFYVLGLTLSKAGTFMLLARLTKYTRHASVAYAGLILTAVWGFSVVLALCFRCKVPSPWAQKDLKCFQAYPTWMGIETSGIGMEFLVAILPVYIAWGLHVHLKSKIVLLFAFSFRLPVIIVAALRIFYLHKQHMMDDQIFYGVDPSVCMEVELHYSLIAATIPCLKPFVKSFNTGYLGRLEIVPDAFRDTIPLQDYKPPRTTLFTRTIPVSAAIHLPSYVDMWMYYPISPGKCRCICMRNTGRNGPARSAAIALITKPLNIGSSPSTRIIPCASLEPQSPLTPHRPQHCRNRYIHACVKRPHLPKPSKLLSRPYHSSFHPTAEPPADTYTPEQSAILSAAVNHIPEHGFTTHSLTLGAREAGYLDVSLQLFHHGGEIELITYWLRSRRAMLRRKAESGELFGKPELGEVRGLSVEERVVVLILERLKMNEEIIEHWQDALATMSLPFNIAPSISELYALSSDILYLANDTSVDFSWYTKRLSAATVYASADVFMTEDTSPGFTATKEFVERQLSDVNSVTGSIGEVKRYLGFVSGTVAGLGRSWGMKI